MASQFRLGSQMSSSPFGGFSTSTQRKSTQDAIATLPPIPSQPHVRLVSQPHLFKPNLYNADAALLAEGTSDMASLLSGYVPEEESSLLSTSGEQSLIHSSRKSPVSVITSLHAYLHTYM